MRWLTTGFCIAILLNSLQAASQLHLKPYSDSPSRNYSFFALPQNFYNQHIGFFCKREIDVQKTTSLPLFIRLGSKEYVDYLERKPGAIKNN